MISDARYSRLLARRETHRSRSTAVGVVLAILVLGLAYVGTECVLAALRLRPLLVSPENALRLWREQPPALLGGAAAAALLGVVVLLLAVLPARRPRHRIRDDRSVLLVDDDLLASAVSQSVARRTGVGPGQTRTAVGRRSALVAVTPTSGQPLSEEAIGAHAAELIDGLGLEPRVSARARLASAGKVDA